MPKESDPSERLIDAISRLTDHLEILGDILDKFHVSFEWAVENDRFRSVSEDGQPAGSLVRVEHARRDDLDASPPESQKIEDLRATVSAMQERQATTDAAIEEMRS